MEDASIDDLAKWSGATLQPERHQFLTAATWSVKVVGSPFNTSRVEADCLVISGAGRWMERQGLSTFRQRDDALRYWRLP